MNVKRIGMMLVLVALLAVGAAAVAADPARPAGGERPATAAAIEAAAAETGQTRAEVVAALRGGSTLADVVTDAGGDVQAVIDAAVSAGQERIDAALADGRITDEQAATLGDELVAGVTAAVNGESGPRWIGARAVRISAERILLQETADATGLTTREVRQAWRSGQSLAEIAATNGSSREAVLASALATATERIDAAVADGRMTQTQADVLLTALPDRFSTALDAVHTPRGVRGAI